MGVQNQTTTKNDPHEPGVLDKNKEKTTYTPSRGQNEKKKKNSIYEIFGRNHEKRVVCIFVFYLVLLYYPSLYYGSGE